MVVGRRAGKEEEEEEDKKENVPLDMLGTQRSVIDVAVPPDRSPCAHPPAHKKKETKTTRASAHHIEKP